MHVNLEKKQLSCPFHTADPSHLDPLSVHHHQLFHDTLGQKVVDELLPADLPVVELVHPRKQGGGEGDGAQTCRDLLPVRVAPASAGLLPTASSSAAALGPLTAEEEVLLLLLDLVKLLLHLFFHLLYLSLNLLGGALFFLLLLL